MMNISMERALEDSKKPGKNIEDVGFILTVLRDNTTDDFVYEILNNLIKNNS